MSENHKAFSYVYWPEWGYDTSGAVRKFNRTTSWPPRQWEDASKGSYGTEPPIVQRALSYEAHDPQAVDPARSVIPRSYINDRSAWRGTTQKEHPAWGLAGGQGDDQTVHGARRLGYTRHYSYDNPLLYLHPRTNQVLGGKPANITELSGDHVGGNSKGKSQLVTFSGVDPSSKDEKTYEMDVFGGEGEETDLLDYVYQDTMKTEVHTVKQKDSEDKNHVKKAAIAGTAAAGAGYAVKRGNSKDSIPPAYGDLDAIEPIFGQDYTKLDSASNPVDLFEVSGDGDTVGSKGVDGDEKPTPPVNVQVQVKNSSAWCGFCCGVLVALLCLLLGIGIGYLIFKEARGSDGDGSLTTSVPIPTPSVGVSQSSTGPSPGYSSQPPDGGELTSVGGGDLSTDSREPSTSTRGSLTSTPLPTTVSSETPIPTYTSDTSNAWTSLPTTTVPDEETTSENAQVTTNAGEISTMLGEESTAAQSTLVTTEPEVTTEFGCGCECARGFWTDDCSNEEGNTCRSEGLRIPEPNDCAAYQECRDADGSVNFKFETVSCPDGEVYNPAARECLDQEELVCSATNSTGESPGGPCSSDPCEFDGVCIEYTNDSYGCACRVDCAEAQEHVGDNCQYASRDVNDKDGICADREDMRYPFAGRCDLFVECGADTELIRDCRELDDRCGRVAECYFDFAEQTCLLMKACDCVCARNFWTDDCSSRGDLTCDQEGERLPESDFCTDFVECTTVGDELKYEVKTCDNGTVYDPVTWGCIDENLPYCNSDVNSTSVNITDVVSPCASNPCQYDGECIDYLDGTYGCACKYPCSCSVGDLGDNCEYGLTDWTDLVGRQSICDGRTRPAAYPFAGSCERYIFCSIVPNAPAELRSCRNYFPTECPTGTDCYFVPELQRCVPASPLPDQCKIDSLDT